jgi:hypothetical protein
MRYGMLGSMSPRGIVKVRVGLVVLGVLGLTACRRDNPPAPEATASAPADAPPTKRVVGPLSPEDARALGTMNDRLTAYVELHRRLEATLPSVPKSATPEQIDRNQRKLEILVRDARAGAKPGDLFTPEARPVILRLLATVFGGPEGAQLKASIMDENPVGIKLAVNGRYPDNVPISTVPPEVLQTLPQLAEDMEYRFIGDRLILMDVHAHLVADFIEDALPK